MAAHANARLEAFCDGVFAIALTLLIIDVKLPEPERIDSTSRLWTALQHLASSSVFAFLLSFLIILITWVNHHAALGHLNKTSTAFIYANGFLLLTVVFIPFPTALLGEFLWTDHAAPAVVLYNAVLAIQALAWVLVSRVILAHKLTAESESMATARQAMKNGYFGFAFYSLLSISALWFPVTTAIVTTMSMIFWMVLGIRLKRV